MGKRIFTVAHTLEILAIAVQCPLRGEANDGMRMDALNRKCYGGLFATEMP